MKDFLTNLNPIRKVAWLLFTIWAMWGTLSYRIWILEKEIEKMDNIKIEMKLAQIQVDLERIKNTLKQHTN